MNRTLPDLTGIKNIIFDFGRVLLNINPQLTMTGLAQLGYLLQHEKAGKKDDDVVVQLEMGLILPSEFKTEVISLLKDGVTEEEVIHAWNAMLLDFPQERVSLLKRLKKDYKLYLLSNSNLIHYDYYTRTFLDRYGFELSTLFEKEWYSFNLGMIKPDPEIFSFVLTDGELNPSETFFIDDTLVNVEAASRFGIRTYHLTSDVDITELF
ncbi:MAG: HAD family phosphatase [Lentimicrobiaceae bacterium]